MKRLGNALHVVQQKLIVRGAGESIPRANSPVIDRSGSRIGKVYDVFGPVKSPYIVVRLNRGVDSAGHVGKMLYVGEASRRDNKWKR
ncbi:MAG: RNA-binding protein [Methanosarcinales archaeon]|nr:RNA-binding protein [Methanosarcinales archaeon]